MKRSAFLSPLIAIVLIILNLFIPVRYISAEDVSLLQKPSDSVMTPKDMKQDLDYVVDKLTRVPCETYKGIPVATNNIIKETYKKINNPLKLQDFFFLMQNIFVSLGDAHTTSMLELDNNDEVIELPISWLNQGIYIERDSGKFIKGDQVVKIGGLNENELFKKLSTVVPTENNYWIKVQAKKMLLRGEYLKHFGLALKGYVNVQVKRKNKLLTFQLPLIKKSASKLFKIKATQSKNLVDYYMVGKGEKSLGVFQLNECINSDEYKKKLHDFFAFVNKNNIKNVVVDLRNNFGGDSSVVDEFIKYLNVKKYIYYGGEVRTSKEYLEAVGVSGDSENANKYLKNLPKEKNNEVVKDKNLVYGGKLYVLTSPSTFSSAAFFAATIKDNNMGQIIGEPTGNKPSMYGNYIEFFMPNSGIEFVCSTIKFIRPNQGRNNENALVPDVQVYSTAKDMISGRDTQMEYLKSTIGIK